MKEIKCPKDLQFENIFSGKDCEEEKAYNDCYHCWSSSIVKFKQDVHNEAIQQFSDLLLKQDIVDKSVIRRLTVQCMKHSD